MADGNSRPMVFLSSTIRDFSDLRGAVRFWLEEAGCEVWLSDYTDVDKLPVPNSFAACFEAIRRSDFYILLIGQNRGSWYSEPDQISVTEQEYRVAYDAFRAQGHPVPLMFVRTSVMDLLAGWRTGSGSKRLRRRPPFPDAAFVARFVAEVKREPEMRAAVARVGDPPQGNWLYRFAEYRHIIDALRIGLNLRVDLPRERLLSGIQLDLEQTLTAFMRKWQGKPSRERAAKIIDSECPGEQVSRERRQQLIDAATTHEVDLPLPGHRNLKDLVEGTPLNANDHSPVRLNLGQIHDLAVYLFSEMVAPDRIRLDALRRAVETGGLLVFDPVVRSLRDTELSRAAIELLAEAEGYIVRFRTVEPGRHELIAELFAAHKAHRETFSLDWNRAVFIWGAYLSQVNLFRRLTSLYAYLARSKSNPLPDPHAMVLDTPLGPEVKEEIRRETADVESIREWVKTPGFWNL
ncbi:MAG: DUF4062 domain-containing protein [Chloroflexota bacterium]|nr:MAG: DUF4062 domain-containing protein [Chloroflexota bacterium]